MQIKISCDGYTAEATLRVGMSAPTTVEELIIELIGEGKVAKPDAGTPTIALEGPADWPHDARHRIEQRAAPVPTNVW